MVLGLEVVQQTVWSRLVSAGCPVLCGRTVACTRGQTDREEGKKEGKGGEESMKMIWRIEGQKRGRRITKSGI